MQVVPKKDFICWDYSTQSPFSVIKLIYIGKYHSTANRYHGIAVVSWVFGNKPSVSLNFVK